LSFPILIQYLAMSNPCLYTSGKIAYHYTNQTQQIQIVRVDLGFNEWIERAVFPNKYFCFDAPPDARLEVYTYAIATAVLSDQIPCQQLSCAV
jgi:cyclopropane fatty-acyl-phospholipid synthase-like methyltransferase